MPIPTVAVQDVNDQIIASIEAQLGQTIPLLPKAFARVIAKALAAVITKLYKYIGWIFLQMFVATAVNEEVTIYGRRVNPLQSWGVLVGAGLPDPATAAEFDVDFAVTNLTGDVLPAGTQFVGETNQITYLSTASVTVNTNPLTIPVIAAGDQAGTGGVGTIGNLEVGATVSFVTAPAGVLQDGAVSNIVTTAADAESTAAYRQRIIDRFAKKPQGGALVDYEVWGEEAEGIINVYPYTGQCPGQVDVYSEATVASSGNPDGFPTQPQLDAVKDIIEQDVNGRATRRPANAWVNSYSITRKGFVVDIFGLDVDDSVAVQAQIEAGLDALFKSFEPYIGGVSILRRDRVTVAAVGGLVNSIVSAANGIYSSIVLRTAPIITQVFEGRCVAGDDDAEETGGVVTIGGTSLDLGGATHFAGMRIPGVTIPPGALVTSASLTLVSDTVNNTYSNLTIRGEAVANAAAYVVAPNDISGRNFTVANTQWVPDGWGVGDIEESPDIGAAVQEILNVAGWTLGNAMNFVITGTDDSDRQIRTFEAGAVQAPLLRVEYEVEGAAPASIQVYTLRKGEKARLDAVNFS